MQVQAYLFFIRPPTKKRSNSTAGRSAPKDRHDAPQRQPEPAKPGMLPARSEKTRSCTWPCDRRHHVMGSDACCTGELKFEGFALSLNVADAAAPIAVRCPRRRREGSDAAGQDLLVAVLGMVSERIRRFPLGWSTS